MALGLNLRSFKFEPIRRCATCVAIAFSLFATLDPVSAVEFVPVREYRNAEDSPFADFGVIGSALIVEDFENRNAPAPGLQISSRNASIVRPGFSVASDSTDGTPGNAYEVIAGGACAASFPPQCPSTATLEFDDSVLTQLPSYVGFVWTDAVRRSEEDVHPWIGIELTNGNNEVASHRIFDFPVRSTLESSSDDDTLFSFVDPSGIQSVQITVMSNGFPETGRLALDHIQYGIATLPGDLNRDGEVNFLDFLAFADEFGNDDASWGEGDFTFDGKTSFEDWLRLSRNFGRRIGDDQKTLTLDAVPVPEPSSAGTLILALAWGIVLASSCRRRRLLSPIPFLTGNSRS